MTYYPGRGERVFPNSPTIEGGNTICNALPSDPNDAYQFLRQENNLYGPVEPNQRPGCDQIAFMSVAAAQRNRPVPNPYTYRQRPDGTYERVEVMWRSEPGNMAPSTLGRKRYDILALSQRSST
jgi:hypothetical protein